MMLTNAQRELLEDKFVLWDRASREGNMELRDYNRRAAEALKVALSICSAAPEPDLFAGNAKKPEPGYEAEPVAIDPRTDPLAYMIFRTLDVMGVVRLSAKQAMWVASEVRRYASPASVAISREDLEQEISEAVLSASVEVPDDFGDRVAMRRTITKNTADAILQRLSNQQGGGGKGSIPRQSCADGSLPVLTETPLSDGAQARPPYVFHSLSACAGCGASGDYFPAPDAEAYEATGRLYCDECAEEAIALAKAGQ